MKNINEARGDILTTQLPVAQVFCSATKIASRLYWVPVARFWQSEAGVGGRHSMGYTCGKR